MKCNLGICLEHIKGHLEGLGSIKAMLSAGGSRSLPGALLHPKLPPIPCSHPLIWIFKVAFFNTSQRFCHPLHYGLSEGA